MAFHFQLRKAFAFAAEKIFGHAQTEHPTVRCEKGLQRCFCHSARQATNIQSEQALLQIMRQRLRCRMMTQAASGRGDVLSLQALWALRDFEAHALAFL